jgi:hypothetical protein
MEKALSIFNLFFLEGNFDLLTALRYTFNVLHLSQGLISLSLPATFLNT